MGPLKLAHAEGHTEVCYDNSGSFLLTGGSDGKVCIWEGKDDTDTTSVSVGDKVFSVAFQGGRIFVASGNSVLIHTFPDGVPDGMVTRFAAQSRHISICEDGSMLVAGADDFKVKVISMEDSECIALYAEHQAPILSVALDPTREFVASSSCDGTVKVWGTDGSTEVSLSVLTKCSEPGLAKSQCRMCWSQDGEFLLVPVENEVHILLRSSWEVTGKLQAPTLTDTINVMALCPDGKHVAVGSANGTVAVFNWMDKKLIHSFVHPNKLTITSVAWHPSSPKELAFCDNMGQLGFVEVPIGSEKLMTNGTADKAVFGNDADDDDLLVSQAMDDDAMDGILNDPDDENSFDIGSIKRSLDPYAGDNDDAESTTSSKVPEKTTDVPTPLVPMLPADIFKPTPLQPAFQPGATPEHLSSRFMVWNSIGIVRHYVSDDENSIDIEFHDTSTHHALHIDNKSEFIMADLSDQAVVLASRGEDDTPSKLLCMHFGSWDNSKEWSYDMPLGEEIEAVTVSSSWVAVATASRTVHLFSIGGLQLQVFSLAGPVVALASQGRQLLVTYHKGMGVPGDQMLGVSLIKVKGNTKSAQIKDEALPLSPKSRLAWLGFSDEGCPVYMDSNGIVRMLNKQFNGTWWPVANTKQHVKGKSDHYFMVGVNETQQQMRCIPCKGSRYPPTLPRPAVTVLPLQLSFLDMDTEKSQYEESYQRSHLLATNLCSSNQVAADEGELMRPVREALIKLFAFAAKAEREFRAMEVCEMMGDQSLLHLAATYATRLRRIQLAERVNQLMQRRQDEEDGEQERAEEEEEKDEEEKDLRVDTANGDESDEETENMKQTRQSDDDEGDSQKYSTPGPMLKVGGDREPKSRDRNEGVRKNPFQRASSTDKRPTKGSQVFDKMEKSSPKPSPVFAPLPVSIKKSGKKTSSGQAKLTGFKKSTESSQGDVSSPVSTKEPLLSQYTQEEESENEPVAKKKQSAFDLWLEANQEDLKAEHPDLSEDDLGQKATEAFRALTKEERQVWVNKAKSLTSAAGQEASKKRKLSESETKESLAAIQTASVGEKRPLSQSTNAKLAKFAKVD